MTDDYNIHPFQQLWQGSNQLEMFIESKRVEKDFWVCSKNHSILYRSEILVGKEIYDQRPNILKPVNQELTGAFPPTMVPET